MKCLKEMEIFSKDNLNNLQNYNFKTFITLTLLNLKKSKREGKNLILLL